MASNSVAAKRNGRAAPHADVASCSEWAAQLRNGDAAAFEAVFRAFASELRRFAYRSVRSREAAAEIVQDVFCNVWRGRAGLTASDGLRAYLYRATRNRALDYLAREAVSRRWLEQSRRDAAFPDTRRVAAAADEVAHAAELAAAIERVLEGMPVRRRLVCELRWKHGFAPNEIAQHLQIALKTVETQITRGLKELRHELKEHL